jgi:hypothetical protein
MEKQKKMFAIHRDGELCGVGLSLDDAKEYIKAMNDAHPEYKYSIVPGGDAMPGNKEKK